ncbi:MAG: T9SS type A sorting domain-containing protein [Saprospiraceae bacterium]|nr:T9SS type A sorting domain-containing protein [Saprospiraceae bacterium]
MATKHLTYIFLFFANLTLDIQAQKDFCLRLNQNGLIFCDDFESGKAISTLYFEHNNNNGDFVPMPSVGRDASNGMRVLWQASEVSAGGLSKSFGRTPQAYIGRNAAMPDSTFKEIYWRMDVRHQDGWQGGGPAKLSRALCLANSNWATGAMAHLWSGGPADAFLGMDPASGINAQGTLVSTKYNDFANLRWLGFKHGNIPMFSSERAAEWHCVEGHIKLNTPGNNNGLMEFWINDTLQAGSYQMNWHGNWNSNPNNYGINAIFFENYWNAGSPVQQERYFDNLVIATQRIGCNQLTSSTSKPDQDPIKIWFDQNGMLNWDAESNQIYRLKIMSPQGQIISVIDIQNSGRTEIENQLPAGIYFYQLNRGADILSSGKLNIY